MRQIPIEVGIIHIVGIGGIGMSGIAELMHNLGYPIQGSDLNENANVIRLRELGIPITIGHSADGIEGAGVVVISTAVKANNPEVIAAREAKIPVVPRAEMLAELMRLKWCVSVAGTHGKTTTTSMVAAMLDAGEFDPTVINGGIINAYGTNARLGAGDWMVVEADESDGTFVKVPATLAIVTNIDPEHLDFFGTFEAEKAAFLQFVEGIPFYGAAILCIDHPEVQQLIAQISDRKVITYGTSPQADVRATDIRFGDGGAEFSIDVAETVNGSAMRVTGLHLPMPGIHNVRNALAALCAALELGLSETVMRRAFDNFKGVKRRFTKIGDVAGITIIDDYAHHPVEISSVLAAAREAYEGQVIAVIQPHRYTRLQSLFEEFCTCVHHANTVIVMPVFEAGESPIEGINRDTLADGMKAHGHRDVVPVDGPEELAPKIAELCSPGDVIMCLGAGSISAYAHDLPAEISSILDRNLETEGAA